MSLITESNGVFALEFSQVGSASDTETTSFYFMVPWELLPYSASVRVFASAVASVAGSGGSLTGSVRWGDWSASGTVIGSVVGQFFAPEGVTDCHFTTGWIPPPVTASEVQMTLINNSPSVVSSVLGRSIIFESDLQKRMAMLIGSTQQKIAPSTSDTVFYQWVVNFEQFAPTVNLALCHKVYTALGENGIYSIRLGGTDGEPDGSLLLAHSSSRPGGDGAPVERLTSFSNPGGKQFVKLTVRTNTGFNVFSSEETVTLFSDLP